MWMWMWMWMRQWDDEMRSQAKPGPAEPMDADKHGRAVAAMGTRFRHWDAGQRGRRKHQTGKSRCAMPARSEDETSDMGAAWHGMALRSRWRCLGTREGKKAGTVTLRWLVAHLRVRLKLDLFCWWRRSLDEVDWARGFSRLGRAPAGLGNQGRDGARIGNRPTSWVSLRSPTILEWYQVRITRCVLVEPWAHPMERGVWSVKVDVAMEPQAPREHLPYAYP